MAPLSRLPPALAVHPPQSRTGCWGMEQKRRGTDKDNQRRTQNNYLYKHIGDITEAPLVMCSKVTNQTLTCSGSVDQYVGQFFVSRKLSVCLQIYAMRLSNLRSLFYSPKAQTYLGNQLWRRTNYHTITVDYGKYVNLSAG